MRNNRESELDGNTPPYTVRRSRRQMVADVRQGLTRSPKQLSPKYFYDERGSELFEEITQLPEYYLTRSERLLLEQRITEIISAVRPCSLVELGAGFAGSDLESAVAEIGHEAVRIGDENVPADYLRNAFRNVVPLSRSAPERIEEVRQLGDRAIPASGRQPSLGVVGAQPRARRVVLS